MLIHKGKQINQVIFSGEKPVTKVYHLEKGEVVGLPEGVSLLEYIESAKDSCSYIDLDYTLHLGSEIEVTIEFPNETGYANAVYVGGFDTVYGSMKGGFCIKRWSNRPDKVEFLINNCLWGNYTVGADKKAHFVLKENSVTMNGSSVGNSQTYGNPISGIPLRVNLNSTTTDLTKYGYAKYGEIIVRENGTVLHDYKPAIVEGVAGFFDTKTKKFFSPTVGEFSAGPQL